MVKRIILLLICVFLLVTPLSFAEGATIVDEGGYFTEEEHQELKALLDNLQRGYQMKMGVYFVNPDKPIDEVEDFYEYLNGKYSFESEKYLVFAYNAQNQTFYGYSNGLELLDTDKQQEILNEVAALDLGGRAAEYAKVYFGKAVPYLGVVPEGSFTNTEATEEASAADALPTPGAGDKEEEQTEAKDTPPVQDTAKEAKVYLEDKANLWTEDEKAKLLEKASQISKKEDVAIVLATTDDNPKRSSEAYIEDLAEEKFGIDTNQLAFLIDMDKRKVEINTAGKAIDIFDDVRINSMLDKILEQGMKKQDYYKAADLMLDDAAYYLEQGVHSGYEGRKERTEPNSISLLDGLAGLGLAGGTGFGHFARTRKRYQRKAAPMAFQYRSNIIGELPPVAGTLIDRRVTTRIIPKASSGGGSGGGRSSTTHSSGSGGTRGGGGRSF